VRKMIVYEFWLKEQFKSQAFEDLCKSFDMGKDEYVFSISRNSNTHWVQILVGDTTPEPVITAIDAKINGLKDDEPLRKYNDDKDNDTPIETPRHFSLDQVLRVRQKQKDGTLREIEDSI